MSDEQKKYVPSSEVQSVELSVVMPCLNEEKTLGDSIKKAKQTMSMHGIEGEVVVADNGSTDRSAEIARELGARVVNVQRKGYGSALMGGISAARGKFVIMGDPDGSYEWAHIPRYLEKLREGFGLVMGNRFKGGIEKGAMPFLHRYLGNPAISAIGRLFFGSPCGDFNCGLRAFEKKEIERLNLCSPGMEFASEMVVKSTLMGVNIIEVPTILKPDGRDRRPHLRTWQDGWRNLRFLLLYSPRWLFLYPGLLFISLGMGFGGWLLTGPKQLFGINLNLNSLLFSSLIVLLGFQSVVFAVFSKLYGHAKGYLPASKNIDRFQRFFTLEKGLGLGLTILAAGIGFWGYETYIWASNGFSPLVPDVALRNVIPGFVLILLGFQTILSSFFVSLSQMEK